MEKEIDKFENNYEKQRVLITINDLIKKNACHKSLSGVFKSKNQTTEELAVLLNHNYGLEGDNSYFLDYNQILNNPLLKVDEIKKIKYPIIKNDDANFTANKNITIFKESDKFEFYARVNAFINSSFGDQDFVYSIPFYYYNHSYNNFMQLNRVDYKKNSKETFHVNKFKVEMYKDITEYRLAKKYFTDFSLRKDNQTNFCVRYPHVHFNTGYQSYYFKNQEMANAISLDGIIKYLTDLKLGEDKNLQKYDLGMPFLSFLKKDPEFIYKNPLLDKLCEYAAIRKNKKFQEKLNKIIKRKEPELLIDKILFDMKVTKMIIDDFSNNRDLVTIAVDSLSESINIKEILKDKDFNKNKGKRDN